MTHDFKIGDTVRYAGTFGAFEIKEMGIDIHGRHFVYGPNREIYRMGELDIVNDPSPVPDWTPKKGEMARHKPTQKILRIRYIVTEKDVDWVRSYDGHAYRVDELERIERAPVPTPTAYHPEQFLVHLEAKYAASITETERLATAIATMREFIEASK